MRLAFQSSPLIAEGRNLVTGRTASMALEFQSSPLIAEGRNRSIQTHIGQT